MSDDRKSEVRVKKLTDDFEFRHEDVGKPSIIHVILLNRTLRILCALVVFCMLIPILDYFYFYSTEMAEYEIDDSGICSHYPIYQIPCGVSENTTESECIENACCYSAATGCYHFLPSKYQLRSEHPWSAIEHLVPTKTLSPYKTRSFVSMKLDIEMISENIVSILLWNPELVSRVAVTNSNSSFNAKYDIRVFSPDLFVEVRRKIDNRTILSTARGALIASENYFEWSIHLGGGNIKLMGFDTTHMREGQRILINNAHSSVIPYVVAYDRQSKHYHAVHFESIDSPAELQILKSNTIIIRQYSSASFRMRAFMGPSYGEIYRQLKSSVERHYIVPSENWPFGVHYCPTNFIYNETETKIELNHLLTNLQSIPFDSHCIHSDLTALIVSRDGDNVLASFDEILSRLKHANKKIFLHMTLTAIDADGIDSNELQELALTNNHDDSIFTGLYGKTRKVFYLDYITKSPEIVEWLRKQRQHLNSSLTMSDGLMLYRAFPFDDTINKSLKYLESFHFIPRNRKNFESAVESMIPLNVKLQSGEPLIHQLNNYGRAQIEVLGETLNDDGKKFCIADSYRETTKSCGMLMRVERASWTSFQSTIHKSVFYSLIGMSFYGAEVCSGDGGGSGDGESVPEDLCIRWYQFAIFMPLFYVNAHKMPTKFTKYAERIMVHTIRTRYALLSYMRTCMLTQMPLLRPLRYVYGDINDDDKQQLHSINSGDNDDEDDVIELISNHQLMFGDALMIAPIMEPLVVEVNLYFPEKYFELWSGVEMPQSAHFSIVMHDIPIFIRAGHIIALNLAHESVSAEEARLQPYLLIIALSCTERYTCYAMGQQHIVDGVEFKFEASEAQLNIKVITDGNPIERRNAICGLERIASSEFHLAKIYGLGDFKERYRSNDYLSLDLDICDADWNEIFSISI